MSDTYNDYMAIEYEKRYEDMFGISSDDDECDEEERIKRVREVRKSMGLSFY